MALAQAGGTGNWLLVLRSNMRTLPATEMGIDTPISC